MTTSPHAHATTSIDSGGVRVPRPRSSGRPRGFAVLKLQGRLDEVIASAKKGGRAAQERYDDPYNDRPAHRFTRESASAAGKKGHANRRAAAAAAQADQQAAA